MKTEFETLEWPNLRKAKENNSAILYKYDRAEKL
jgi:hypothetical protein